jgi:glycosyltransferase involved in cell wall biosynthesis
VGTIAKLMVPSVKLVTHIRKLPDSYPFIVSSFWLWLHSKFSDQVICVSKEVKRQLGKNYPTILIYDGIQEAEKYPPHKFFNGEKREIKFLYIGHFIPGKGQDYALEAFRIAQKECKNIRLKFVGGDMGLKKNMEFKKSLQKKAENWRIDNLIEFVEFTSDVEREMKKADIVLNFSESESFSFTCLEALYYGTPLIATDSGGPAELFENKRSGRLVPNRDVDSMVKAILELSSDLKLMQKYSRNSRDYIRENFDFSTWLVETNHVYKSLLNSKV